MPETPPEIPPQLPAAPPAAPGVYVPTPDDRNLGMLTHLLGLFTGIIGVLIMWLCMRERSPFLDHHGKEAVNFQLTLLLIGFVSGGLILVTLGLGALLIVPLLVVYGILCLVWEIMGCIAASNGEWHRYPMTIRMVQ